MFDKALSPGLQKRKLPEKQVSWSPENVSDDTIENIDPESDQALGILEVQFKPNGEFYRWETTYQEYQDFRDSGFDTAWLNENVDIEGGGSWGWPFGRTKLTGFAERYNR